jgi:hypothetical protein
VGEVARCSSALVLGGRKEAGWGGNVWRAPSGAVPVGSGWLGGSERANCPGRIFSLQRPVVSVEDMDGR